MSKWNRIFLVLLIVLSCVGCDQATKAIVKEQLPRHEVLSFAGDTFRLQYAENRGAFLSLGDHLSDGWRSFLFTGIVALFLVALLAYLLSVRRSSLPTLIAWSLVCGGGVGNLVDRAAHAGYVVDFLNCGVGSFRTGIFNVADMAITAGLFVLVFVHVRPRLAARDG